MLASSFVSLLSFGKIDAIIESARTTSYAFGLGLPQQILNGKEKGAQ